MVEFSWLCDFDESHQASNLREETPMWHQTITILFFVQENSTSIHYSIPELCKGTSYIDPEANVWSLGVTLYAMMSARLPFNGATQFDIQQSIVRGAFFILENFSEDLKDLIRRMLEVNLVKRATIEDIMVHPWLKTEEEEKEEGQPIRFRSLSATSVLPATAKETSSSSLRQELEKMAVKLQSF